MKDPADDVKETRAQMEARLDALRKGRGALEKNVMNLMLAHHNAQRALERHDRNIAAVEKYLALMNDKGEFEIRVDRQPREQL